MRKQAPLLGALGTSTVALCACCVAFQHRFLLFWGVAFADLLRPFDWWGYLQEDLLVGDLRAFATDELLARSDVVSPYLPPLNASGVLMLFRNSPAVNNVWRKSRAAGRVLSSPKYLVFDEW